MKSKLIILITVLFVVIVSIGMTILNSDLIQREFNQGYIMNQKSNYFNSLYNLGGTVCR